MKRTITQNDLMMFIIEENLLDAYNMDLHLYIYFEFIDENEVVTLGMKSFMNISPNDVNYIYINNDTYIDISGDLIVKFYFIRV